MSEVGETFACFGGECAVIVSGADELAVVPEAKRRLLEWHHRLSRFESDSELSRLNADPRRSVQVSPIVRRVVEAAINAARRTVGLADPTLLGELERAGYDRHFEGSTITLEQALVIAPPRASARPAISPRWQNVDVDRRAGTITRPPGVRLDPGGIAKGVFADELAAALANHEAFAVDCAGDVRVGGRSNRPRTVNVASPLSDQDILHEFEIRRGAAATSGIGKRSWLDREGRPAHHLLDPSSGRPAFTGIIQVTALAPTATEAEALSKAALLSGPAHARSWLPHGGLVVFDDGAYSVFTDDGTRESSHAVMSSST